MAKHTAAINALTDELADVVRNVKYLQICLGKSKMRSAIFPSDSVILLSADLRWRRSMKEQLEKGKSLEASIQALKALEGEE